MQERAQAYKCLLHGDGCRVWFKNIGLDTYLHHLDLGPIQFQSVLHTKADDAVHVLLEYVRLPTYQQRVVCIQQVADFVRWKRIPKSSFNFWWASCIKTDIKIENR